MTRNRILGGLAGVAAIALLVTSCAPDTEVGAIATSTPTPSASRSAVPSPPPEPDAGITWPLTGIDATDVDESDLARPALSIKIENSSAARPQQNLDAADVVFEEYVEYGISRLVAIYHSDIPESVGPVRSMRPMDKNIMGSFAGPLIFSGAQGRFVTQTVNTGQKVITQDRGDSGFYRTSDKAAPHNLHGKMSDFLKQAADMPAPPAQWDIVGEGEDPSAAAGKSISGIDIFMSGRSNPSWDWDDADSVWQRSEDGKAHVTTSGTQMSASNVVMLWVTVKYTSAAGGSSVPETIVVTDSGTGYVASNNTMIPITWSKAGQFDPYIFSTEDGEPVQLAPGKTWVELVPNKGIDNSTSIDFS